MHTQTHNGTDYTLPIQKGGKLVLEGNTGLKQDSRENSKLCSFVFKVKRVRWPFRFPTTSSFVDCITLLLLGLCMLPVYSSSWEPICCGMYNTLGSLQQSRLFPSFMEWFLWASMHDSFATCLCSVAFLNQGGSFHDSFILVSFMTPKPEPYG